MLSVEIVSTLCRRYAWTLPKAPEVAKVIKQFPLSPPEPDTSPKTSNIRSRSKQNTNELFKGTCFRYLLLLCHKRNCFSSPICRIRALLQKIGSILFRPHSVFLPPVTNYIARDDVKK